MPKIFHFFLSERDQARVDTSSVVVEDYSEATEGMIPEGLIVPPQSLIVSFRITDPQNLAPQIRPLFPGLLNFFPDGSSLGYLPSPQDINFTDEQYSNWNVRGTIRISVDEKTWKTMLPLSIASLEVIPNLIWYSPIRLSQAFLFQTIKEDMKSSMIIEQNDALLRLPPNHPQWPKQAVSYFLKKNYSIWLRQSQDISNDDISRFPMPTVDMGSDGRVTLIISAAYTRSPQDYADEFDKLAQPGLTRLHPLHPANGLIPARYVLRKIRQYTIDADPGKPFPDKVLADGPQTLRYHPIYFTRTSKKTENCSIYFPMQQVQILDEPGNLLYEQRLPAHGVVYISQRPNSILPKLHITLLPIQSDFEQLYLLRGEQANNWRIKGAPDVLEYDLQLISQPHVILRRRMSREMFSEEEYTYAPKSNSCSYLAIRRSLRALINNRIAGGRLNYEFKKTSDETKDLLLTAWNDLSNKSSLVNAVINGKPSTQFKKSLSDAQLVDLLRDRSEALLPILEAFFPDDAPQQEIDGTTTVPNQKKYKMGKMAYYVWQSAGLEFRNETTKRNFGDEHIGRGGPGALVALSLARVFHVDPEPEETPSQIIEQILSGLEPGAILQFWTKREGFEALKNRQPYIAEYGLGHSPVFYGYFPENPANLRGFFVVDQHFKGHDLETLILQSLVPVNDDGTLQWGGEGREIWIAANWDE